jgi:hypothetical protein
MWTGDARQARNACRQAMRLTMPRPEQGKALLGLLLELMIFLGQVKKKKREKEKKRKTLIKGVVLVGQVTSLSLSILLNPLFSSSFFSGHDHHEVHHGRRLLDSH